jgi:uncharacterized protein (DUF1501 family)
VLVIVQMAGGNDGLNTVVPVADGRYYDARPGLAIAQAEALPLDAQTGLHPSLTTFKALWDAGLLAMVEGVGYPNPNFSHFVSMDVWQGADPTHKAPDGWLGRYFASSALEAPFLGLAIGRELPAAFATPSVATPSLESLAAYQFQGDPRAPASLNTSRKQALLDMYDKGVAYSSYGPQFRDTVQAADVSIQSLQSAASAYKPSVTYPTSGLGSALQLVAQAIAGGSGVKVCHVSIGGFDTHADELTDQARQLGTLSAALGAFYEDLKARSLDSRVLIMTWSEFGRRVKSNASGGTDHGSAAPLFFLGTPVKGGRYGQRPDLGNLDNGNLRYTVDFRSTYATVAEGWLGVSSKDLLGASFETLPLLR